MGHATATFNGRIIAETDTYEFVEGNVYFPPSSLDNSVFTPSTHTTFCPWKGTASYYDVSVGGQQAKDAAWFYANTITDRASGLKDHVAFYKAKVEVKAE
ncbi:hypothetical protein XPA_007179 [Xanthoria parietina]